MKRPKHSSSLQHSITAPRQMGARKKNASRLQHAATPSACRYFLPRHHLLISGTVQYSIIYFSTFFIFHACDVSSRPLPRIMLLAIRSEVLYRNP